MRSVLALLLCCAAPLAAQDTLKIPASQQPAPPDTAPPAQAPPRERAGGIRIPLEELSRIRIRPRSEAAVAVPELGGLAAAEARAALARAGLVAGEVDELPVAGRPAGTVVMQRPAAGTRVPRGSAVGMMLAAPALAAAPFPPPPDDPPPPAQERPVPPPPVVRTPPVAQTGGPAVAPPPEPIAVLPAEPVDAIGDAGAGAAPPVEAPADLRPTVEPTAPVAQQSPAIPTPDVAVPVPARTAARWLPWLLAALVVLAAAATVRRLRAGVVPTTVHARTRHGAEAARVTLRGAPFGDARVRMRVRNAGAGTSSTSPFALR